jgi:predicted CXXCH cytochrome family protein
MQIKSRAGVSGFLLALLVTFSGSALAAGVADTKHNLSTSGTGTIKSTDQTEICVFCHTPHDAIKNDNIPLWNHTLSATAAYGVYTSPTFDGSPTDLGGATAATAAVSSLCLSCHDGSVAVNSMNNPSNTSPTTTMAGGVTMIPAGATNLGAASDALKNDHPVNFTYDTALATADGGLVAPASLAGVKLFSGMVQCASCHDPHTSADPSGKALLRVSQTGSGLCFACHSK